MEKRDNSLLDLEKKIENYNEKEHILNKMKFNKPNMNMNNLNNKFNKDNLLSFLNNFKKENEKIINDPDKKKYIIEGGEQDNIEDEEEEEEEDEIKNININLDENDDNEENKKNKKNKKETIELDLLMGILEQQKKKEITIQNIIENKKKEKDELDKLENKNIEKGEEEIIDFLLEKK